MAVMPSLVNAVKKSAGFCSPAVATYFVPNVAWRALTKSARSASPIAK